MKKIVVLYSSNGGNVEVLANTIAKGAEDAGAQVIIKHVQDAKLEDVTTADAVAFGSPSLNNNNIDQEYMSPFIKQFKELVINKKPTVLFGSYGWDKGAFLKTWKETMIDYDFDVIGELAVNESPDNSQLETALALGKLLAK